jgi:nucleoside-diphosphate-sugar epimerase
MSALFKIFLLGCSGKVGAGLTQRLCASGISVFGIRGLNPCLVNHPLHECVSANLLTDDLSSIIASNKPELLVHTSWEMTPGSYWNDPVNFLWTDRSKILFRQFMDLGGKKIVVTGSCAEYFWGSASKLSELSPEEPASVYGESKLQLLRFIQEENYPYLWTRTFFQFGGKKHNTKLIPLLINSALTKNSVVLRNPNDIRDFIHTNDITAVIAKLINNQDEDVVNIGSGFGYRVTDVVDLIERTIGRKPVVTYSEENGVYNSVVSDSTHLKNLLGDFDLMPLPQAIKCTIDDYTGLK